MFEHLWASYVKNIKMSEKVWAIVIVYTVCHILIVFRRSLVSLKPWIS